MSTLEVLNENLQHTTSILIAEDSVADAEFITQLLEQSSPYAYHTYRVNSFDDISPALDEIYFDVLILNLNLPDRSGLTNVSQLRQSFPKLPIVVLTGQDNLNEAIDSLKCGAQEYITKNDITADLLARSVSYAKQRIDSEIQLKNALDETTKKYEQLERIAKHDFLTQLPNRSYFETVINRNIYNAMQRGKSLALLYLDLNGFKKINDTFGHEVGDELLKQVANRLKNDCRRTDFIARLGGDEFVVLTDQLEYRSEIFSLVNRILQGFNTPFYIGHRKIPCRPSIGVAFYPEGATPEVLMKQADFAMYEAKEKRNVPVCFYTKRMRQQYSRTLQIQTQINDALEKHEFDVHFQKIIDSKSKEHIIFEALLRWNSHILGNVSPADFIPVIENGPVANLLTELVLVKIAALLSRLPDTCKNITLKVNITVAQLCSQEFLEMLLSLASKLNIPYHYLCLELTERDMIKNVEQCKEHIRKLQKYGIKVALDDFGTGYSSITHLIDLPIDIIKIDRILVKEIHRKTRNQALVAGIIEMAHRLNIKVVAEGVETSAEYELMNRLGSDYTQGFFFATPQPLESLFEE